MAPVNLTPTLLPQHLRLLQHIIPTAPGAPPARRRDPRHHAVSMADPSSPIIPQRQRIAASASRWNDMLALLCRVYKQDSRKSPRYHPIKQRAN
jgi:hypothetical protein